MRACFPAAPACSWARMACQLLVCLRAFATPYIHRSLTLVRFLLASSEASQAPGIWDAWKALAKLQPTGWSLLTCFAYQHRQEQLANNRSIRKPGSYSMHVLLWLCLQLWLPWLGYITCKGPCAGDCVPVLRSPALVVQRCLQPARFAKVGVVSWGLNSLARVAENDVDPALVSRRTHGSIDGWWLWPLCVLAGGSSRRVAHGQVQKSAHCWLL
jgi:hypothetical protein